ncbi:hypothetical protein QR680_001772 [Steinernema hermaphroditum]|uniref:Uncharacterized protein n=1 Tax=Steinernema hermaphroditum TaxID=289476 RepID=A0AA39GZT6_9BILA|nr:hypothetical protein QR680_001772 [Steinernema hermaphroditum]
MTDFDLSIYPTEEFVSFKRCGSTDGIEQIGQNDYVPLAKRPTTDHEMRGPNQDCSSFLPIQDCFSDFISVCPGSFAQQRSNCSLTTLSENVPSIEPHSPTSVHPCLPRSTDYSKSLFGNVNPSFTDGNSNKMKGCDFYDDEEAMSRQLFKDLPTSLAEFESNLDKEKRLSPLSLPHIDTPRSPVESCVSLLSRSPSTYLPVFEEEGFHPDADDLEVAAITESFENQMRKSHIYSDDAQNVSPVLSDFDPYGPAYTTSSSHDRSHFTPNSGFSKHVYSDMSTPCDSIWRPSTEQSGDVSFDIEDMVLTTADSTLSMAKKPSASEAHISPLSFDTFLSAPKIGTENPLDANANDEQLSNATEALAHDVVESLFDNTTTMLDDFPPSNAVKYAASNETIPQAANNKSAAEPSASISKVKADDVERTVPEEEVVDSWEDLDSDDFIPKLAEVQSALNKVSIKNQKKAKAEAAESSKISKYNISNLGHVLEAFQLNSRIRTEAVEAALEGSKCDARVIRVDDSHALIVFSSLHQAMSALVTKQNPIIKLRPLIDASEDTLKKVNSCRSQLNAPRFRPQTNASVARRLIENSLGKRSSVSGEKRMKERQQLKEARDLKNQIAGIWDD